MARSESPATVGRHADVDSRPAPAQALRVGIFYGPIALQARARNFGGAGAAKSFAYETAPMRGMPLSPVRQVMLR